MISILKSV